MRPLRLLLLFALLGGCTVGPHYRPPPLETPPAFVTSSPTSEAVAEMSQLAPPTPSPATVNEVPVDPTRWWTAFGDAELDRLIRRALADSPAIKAAASRIRETRLTLLLDRQEGLPNVGAGGSVSHLDLSKNAGLSRLQRLVGGANAEGNGGQNSLRGLKIPDGSITAYSVGFDASWEIDLFGGRRSMIERDLAAAQATEWNERDAAVTLVAEIANQYFQLRMLQQRELVARGEIARQKRSVEITRNRAKVGLSPETDHMRERMQLADADASLVDLLTEQRVQMHAIATLVGQSPEALIPELSTSEPALPPAPLVAPGIPSDVLRNRPDMRAAERNLAAATADVGVATADLYPHFNLTGFAELISAPLSKLLRSDSGQFGGTAAISFPLLDFGRARTRVRIKREQAEQAYLTYQATVLGALEDVGNALVRVQGEQQRNLAMRSGLSDAERIFAAANASYRAGIVDQGTVLVAQGSLLQAQEKLARSDGMLRSHLISLYKALGGSSETLLPQPIGLDVSVLTP